MIHWIYLRYGDFAHLSGFGDFIYGCMLILWHVYFGDVWFISAATVENFYKCMLYDICWRRDVYFLNKCIIRVFYRFNRSRAFNETLKNSRINCSKGRAFTWFWRDLWRFLTVANDIFNILNLLFNDCLNSRKCLFIYFFEKSRKLLFIF